MDWFGLPLMVFVALLDIPHFELGGLNFCWVLRDDQLPVVVGWFRLGWGPRVVIHTLKMKYK
jgi:hypothetical protein